MLTKKERDTCSIKSVFGVGTFNIMNFYVRSILVVVFSFIKQLSDATDSKMGFTIKQFTEETRIH